AAERIAGAAGVDDTNVFFGVILDERMQDELRITVIATGFDLPGDAESLASSRRSSTPLGGIPRSPSFPSTTSAPLSEPSRPGTPSDDDLNIPPFLRDR
ncbi:MAG: cell division protein FtsZ, partial [Armatimonadetes bacterium]|nr:cell division protein FtsZ [Armatimonadota bacterium]